MRTHTKSKSIRSASETVSSVPSVFSADLEVDVNNQVDPGDTLIESVAADVSQLESWYMWADQEVTVTPFDGASATADGPFTIPAKKALDWDTEEIAANPLTVDFTSLHVHNAGEVAANIKFSFLVHEAS